MDSQAKLIAQLTIGKIVFAALLVCAAWVILKWLRRFFNGLGNRHPHIRFLIRQIEPPIRIILWFGVLFACVEVLAPSKDAVLAVLASAAVAIGLGLQDLIKNVVGGLVIVTDRPFQTGDRVRVDDAYGEVERIGLRSTNILASNGVLVTVPNAELVNSFVFNSNAGLPESLVSTQLTLPHGADPDLVIGIGREIAVACPYTHLGRAISIGIAESGPGNHLKLTIDAYVYDHRYEPAMQTDIFRRANREFTACGLLKSFEANHP